MCIVNIMNHKEDILSWAWKKIFILLIQKSSGRYLDTLHLVHLNY